MVVAEAITIHKPQGSTLGQVVVQLVAGMWRSLVYVAFSRAMLLTGLYILGEFRKSNPSANDNVGKEMDRLRQTSALVPKFAFLRQVPEDAIQVVSHNVTSVKNHHIKAIRNDRVFVNSHLLLIQESWIYNNQSYSIEGMEEIQRNEIDGEHRGTMIYAKQNSGTQAHKRYSFEEGKQRIDITSCKHKDILFINVYKNPATTNDFFKNSLFSISEIFDCDNIVFCGDFNDGDIVKEETRLHRFLTSEPFNLKLLSPRDAPTTDELTTIDAVFGRLRDYTAEVTVYECYFSYHKPLVIRMKEKLSE
jgi:hypothetical protein